MAEPGGTNTQSGIYYQNSVAALALADLLELAPLPPRDRVVEVRVEAPDDVDDIVIRFADGHRLFQNVKTSVAPGSAPWLALWNSLRAQFGRSDFGAEDQFTIVFEDATQTARWLRDMCDRAASSADETEWRRRLSQAHLKLLKSIEPIIGSPSDTLELLRHTTVRLLPLDQIENEFARRRLGGGFTLPAALLSILRDIAGGGARKRALFLASPLRRRLLADYDIEILEPAEWGLLAYRAAIGRLARIEIPGTSVSGSAEELFVWPRARPYERTRPSDFEDEDLRGRLAEEAGVIDMRAFPSDHLDRCVIVAGPGYGKSALLTAIAGRLAQSPHVPVLVPLASLAASEVGIIEFLATQTNRAFDVRADWQRLAEQGLLVLLFDGLDEIPAGVRPTLLNRIATFSARYPLSPWMLTVRDPAVLTGASEARLIEILPLEDDDIERFVETMKHRLPSLDAWTFIARLKMYPDLALLARIPLFLSMLLATIDTVESLPATRSGLIEAYLKTLFAPHEHKMVNGAHDKTIPLRDIAEALAYERLERQEIGASEREVREVILRVTESAVDIEPLFDRLRANGILRQQSAIRLQFPFPIVQEYLAACHLARHFPESLVSRIDDAVQRPWAQVIQFAIELHPDPTQIIRAMLDRPDDAFCTGLRLVGRCIVNGARIDDAIRGEVGDRLVAFWVHASTRARERIGRLLTDGFSNPMSPALRNALHHHWLLNDGAGDIISKANDSELTLSVLNGLMDRKPDHFMMYHSLQPAISAAGDGAFTAIIMRTADDGLTELQLEGIGSLLWHFSPGCVSRELVLATALNEQLPRALRLRAFLVAGPPLDDRSLPVIHDVLAAEDSNEHWMASRLLALAPNRSALLSDVMRDQRLPHKRKCELAGDIALIFPDESERSEFIRRCLADVKLDGQLAIIIQLFAARYGDHSAFETLVDQIDRNPIFLVGQTISLFGHYPGRELAERAADIARARIENSEDATTLARSATTGMLYIYEMDYGFGGALRYTHPHAATGRWMELIEDWSSREDLTDIQRMELLTAASQLGSVRARARLKADVLALTDPDDPKYDEEDDYGNAISSAIHEARRRSPLLPLDVAERFVLAKRPNVPYAGVSAVEAHGNLEAMDLLIKLHNDASEWHLKDTLANSIESMAAKLGIVIRRSDKSLLIVR
jgi:hypothetical protein